MFSERQKNLGYMKCKGAVVKKSRVDTLNIKTVTIEIKNFNEG